MRLSDAKFMERAIERAQPRRQEAPTGEDMSALRGYGDRGRREASFIAPEGFEQFEPVSVMLPETGRRVYGWLVGVEPEGDARVEIGDNEYLIVPPSELRRVGQRNSAELRDRVRSALSHDEGVRSDLQETSQPLPYRESSKNDFILSLSYAAAHGVPSDDDVRRFVASKYPGARILDGDNLMPGRLGVVIHIAEDREAEMGPVAGGEVLETLEPKEADVGCAAAPPARMPREQMDTRNERARYEQEQAEQQRAEERNKQRRLAPQAPQAPRTPASRPGTPVPLVRGTPVVAQMDNNRRSAGEIAHILLGASKDNGSRGPALAARCIQEYIAAGGAQALLKASRKFDTHELLQVAVAATARGKSSLWKDISDFVKQYDNNAGSPSGLPPTSVNTPAPVAPGTGQKKVGPLSPAEEQRMSQLSDLPSPTPAEEAEYDALYERQFGKAPGKPGAPVDQTMADPADQTMTNQTMADPADQTMIGPKGASRRAAGFGRKAEPKRGPMDKYELPPALGEVLSSMEIEKSSRRGDYTVFHVKFAPSKFRSRLQMLHGIASFVKAKATRGPGDAQDFGFIGRPHVVSLDEKKGRAEVIFQSLNAGASPTEVVSPGEGDPAKGYER